MGFEPVSPIGALQLTDCSLPGMPWLPPLPSRIAQNCPNAGCRRQSRPALRADSSGAYRAEPGRPLRHTVEGPAHASAPSAGRRFSLHAEKVMRNLLPPPSAVAYSRRPPLASAALRAIASPSPVPFVFVSTPFLER